MTPYTPANPGQRQERAAHAVNALIALLSLGTSMGVTWQERPDKRVIILAAVALHGSVIWASAFIVMLFMPETRFVFPPLALVGIIAFTGVVYGAATRAQMTAYRMALVAFGLPFTWLVALSIPLFTSQGLFLISYPLMHLFIGTLLIWVLWVVALFLPMWGTVVAYGEVYLIPQPAPVRGEDFRLYTRPTPTIPPDLTAALHQAGIPPDMLLGFLHFNGPLHMRRLLDNRIQPGQAHLLTRLYALVDAQAGISTRLWLSAIAQMRLFWNTLESVDVDTTVREIVTRGGHPIDLRLTFKVRFDPTIITDAEFYMGLSRYRTREEVRAMLHGLLANAAAARIRQTFIHVDFNAALTQASVEQFSQDFPAHMAWVLNLGITVNPHSVQCNPVFTSRVLAAEEGLRASHAEAKSQIARVNALVDRVMHENIPRELLAAMMFFDQGDRLTLNWPANVPLMTPAEVYSAQPASADAGTPDTAPGQQASPPLFQASARVISTEPVDDEAAALYGDWTQSGSDYTLQTMMQRRREQNVSASADTNG